MSNQKTVLATRSPWPVLLHLTVAFLTTACIEESGPGPYTDGPHLVISALDGASRPNGQASFDFGKVVLGSPKTQVFAVTNRGSEAARLGAIASSEDVGLQAPYALVATDAQQDNPPCATGASLSPEQSCLIAVSFDPADETAYSAQLEIEYTDSEATADTAGSTILALKGTGFKENPWLVITPGAAVAPQGSSSPFAFGQVAILTSRAQVFTVTNIGKQPGQLSGVAQAKDVGLSPPFFLAASNAQAGIPPCASGMTLAAQGGACLLTVEFTPVAEGYFTDDLEIRFADPTNAQPQYDKAKLTLTAQAKLDCAIAPELAQARAQGVAAAQAQMELDAAQGTADGMALTYEDGHEDGYSDGYSQGYNQGYNSAQGYPAGYAAGLSAGTTAGQNDQASCNQGTAAGNNQGTAAGNNDGSFDGYEDGYDDGFSLGSSTGYTNGYTAGYAEGRFDGQVAGTADGTSTGQADGYANGYADGELQGITDGEDLGWSDGWDLGYPDGWDYGTASCFGDSNAQLAAPGSTPAPKRAPKDKPSRTGRHPGKSRVGAGKTFGAGGQGTADPSGYVDACYNQGYNATYSTSAYWDAYNAAKAANPQYQSGYATGLAEGKAEGLANGITAGYQAGHNQGYQDGFQQASSALYTQCFNSAYTSAYASAYQSAYNSSYSQGLNQGQADAYTNSYNQGYNAGYEVGWDETYLPAYNLHYSAQYGSGYDEGLDDGYDSGFTSAYQLAFDSGYDAGFAQGEFDACGGFSAMSLLSSRERAAVARSRHVIRIPDHPTPAGIAKPRPRPTVAKKAPRPFHAKPRKNFGVGQKWHKTVRGHNVSTFVPSSHPQSLAQGLVPLRDRKQEGSFRRFLREQNAAKPRQQLLNLKPAAKPPKRQHQFRKQMRASL